MTHKMHWVGAGLVVLSFGCGSESSSSSSPAGTAGVGGVAAVAGAGGTQNAGTGGTAGSLGGSAGAAAGATAGVGGSPDPSGPDLQTLLEEARAEVELPALAGVVLRSNGIVAQAVTGVRRLSEPDEASLDDHWHLGSNFKAVTATLVAVLVEAGLLSFEDTLAELFPDVNIDPQLEDVTLADVLHHRAGLQARGTRLEIDAIPEEVADDPQAFATWLLAQPPEFEIGTHNYSNAGYGLIGAVLERASGSSLQELLSEELVQPLGMETQPWLGWPAATEDNQPWGHYSIIGPLSELPPSRKSLPPALAPAGNFSFTLPDYARFVQLHLRARQGDPQLLTQATFDTLHTPNGTYAMGWIATELGGHSILAHEGSLDGFDAHAAIFHKEDLAIILTTNAGTNLGGEPLTMRWLEWAELEWPERQADD